MIFVFVAAASARARSTTASCAGRKGTPVAPAVGMRAAEHGLFAYGALGTAFCTLRTCGVWLAAGVWTTWIGLAHRTACLGALCAPPKGSMLGMVHAFAWPSYVLATCTRWIGTALTPCAWRRSRLHWFAALWTDFAGLGRCTGWAQPDRFVFGVVRAFVWPIHFLATCTGWKGTALTPRAWGRHWFHRFAAVWTDLGACGI